jgi:hypothetical protein
MSNTATKSPTVSYTYKPSKNAPVIRSLRQDLDLTAALNEYRENNGLVRARNAYSWWKYAFAALVAGPTTGLSMTEIRHQLHSKLGILINATSSGLLKNAVKGKSPCKVRRQYTKNLPMVTDLMELTISKRATPGKKGRPELVFHLRSRAVARRRLIAEFPELELLIVELEK